MKEICAVLELQPNEYMQVKRKPRGLIKKEKKGFYSSNTNTLLAGITQERYCLGTHCKNAVRTVRGLLQLKMKQETDGHRQLIPQQPNTFLHCQAAHKAFQTTEEMLQDLYFYYSK